jgi:hypothetical protein
VITIQTKKSVEVTANSGTSPGLDNVAENQVAGGGCRVPGEGGAPGSLEDGGVGEPRRKGGETEGENQVEGGGWRVEGKGGAPGLLGDGGVGDPRRTPETVQEPRGPEEKTCGPVEGGVGGPRRTEEVHRTTEAGSESDQRGQGWGEAASLDCTNRAACDGASDTAERPDREVNEGDRGSSVKAPAVLGNSAAVMHPP